MDICKNVLHCLKKNRRRLKNIKKMHFIDSLSWVEIEIANVLEKLKVSWLQK